MSVAATRADGLEGHRPQSRSAAAQAVCARLKAETFGGCCANWCRVHIRQKRAQWHQFREGCGLRLWPQARIKCGDIGAARRERDDSDEGQGGKSNHAER